MHIHIRRRSVAFWSLALVVTLALAAGAEEAPDPRKIYGDPETPFKAVEYWKVALKEPRPLKLHVLRIDLEDPAVSFITTAPPKEKPNGKEVRVLRTSAWALQTGVQIAVNTSAWSPVAAEGTPADICGLAASQGEVYSPADPGYPSFNITKDNKVYMGPADKIEAPWNAGSGFNHIIQAGKVDNSGDKKLHPRTAIGVNATGDRLILMVIDGRQPKVSEGVSIPELAGFMRQFGCHEALNLDGGGSSTLVFQREPGQPRVMNVTVGVKDVPRTERPVAQHLGVFIKTAPEKKE